MSTFAAWLGRTSSETETITSAPLQALAATFDLAATPAEVPPLWHWLYFVPRTRRSELGVDGHPAHGSFMPPIALPRRMWAGSRIELHRALPVGEAATRTSTIVSIQEKSGRSGELVFVTVRHAISIDGEPAITEEQDLVFRERGAAAVRDTAAPTHETWRSGFVADPVALFRYSALTFNSHRIHYDWRYATEDEGYPGIVVHGPLIATLLAELVRRQSPRSPRTFACKAISPVFAPCELTLCGAPTSPDAVALWARTPSGALAMEATVTFYADQP